MVVCLHIIKLTLSSNNVSVNHNEVFLSQQGNCIQFMSHPYLKISEITQ